MDQLPPTEIPVKQTEISLGGEPAIRLDGVPSRNGTTEILAVHNDNLYNPAFDPDRKACRRLRMTGGGSLTWPSTRSRSSSGSRRLNHGRRGAHGKVIDSFRVLHVLRGHLY